MRVVICYHDPISNKMMEEVIEMTHEEFITNAQIKLKNTLEKSILNLSNANYQKRLQTMTVTDTAKEIIKQEYKTPESIYNGPYTKTALFLLPMLELTLRNEKIKKYLVNAYLDDIAYEHDYTRPIFLLFKVKSFAEPEYKELFKFITTLPSFRIDYDLGTQEFIDPQNNWPTKYNLVMMVYETPEKWKDDYYHFKAGRYSRFSSEYKLKFPKETLDKDNKRVESLVYGVIHKTAYRKDQVAKHFCVKNDKGTIKDLQEYEKNRKEMDGWAEIWECADKKHEYYNYCEEVK